VFVGQRCREFSIKDVARELHLDWHTVKVILPVNNGHCVTRLFLPQTLPG
jgi:hypothetical protein